jgi:hypothetical protein
MFETIGGARADPSPIDAMTIPLARPWYCGSIHLETPCADPGYVGDSAMPRKKRITIKAINEIYEVV